MIGLTTKLYGAGRGLLTLSASVNELEFVLKKLLGKVRTNLSGASIRSLILGKLTHSQEELSDTTHIH